MANVHIAPCLSRGFSLKSSCCFLYRDLYLPVKEEDQSFTPKEAADLRPKVEQLKAEYDELIELAKAKSKTLKAKQTLHELQQDLSEMDQWIITKLELLKR